MVLALGCPPGTAWSWSGVSSAITLSRPAWSRLRLARMKSAAVSMGVPPRLPLYHGWRPGDGVSPVGQQGSHDPAARRSARRWRYVSLDVARVSFLGPSRRHWPPIAHGEIDESRESTD